MSVRIVVADQSEARFYDAERPGAPMTLASQITDPKAHLHDRDLVSDRPGRVFDHAPPSSGRRGAVGHHATGGERRPRKHEALQFARKIADQLEAEHRDGAFDHMVLMAGPPFLGVLRQVLPEPLRATITAEVPKDLVHQTESVVIEHLIQTAR